MTAPLTIKDLNCGNCPNYVPSTVRRGYMKCTVSNYLLTGTQDIEGHIKITGCASHPLALQVLAGPIIEELEDQIKTRELKEPTTTSSGYIAALSAVIKLLKEGVKKS